MKNGYQRRVYPTGSAIGAKHDVSQYGEFNDLNRAVEHMPYDLQVQWEDLEDFTTRPAYMMVNEIRDGEDYHYMYFIGMEHLPELEANQRKHFD